MFPESVINAAHATALTRWQAPFPGFASGHDPRTSDNAMLTLLYGGLVHAADHDWLNAGRRLIDKTYIEMLWQVQALGEMRTCRTEQVSASLDNFIQGTLSRHWGTLPTLGTAMKDELVATWVDEIAQTCFGSLHSELAASRLLFYLCPMLPAFNLSRGHLMALGQLGYGCRDESYATYARSAAAAYRDLGPALDALPRPLPEFGTREQQAWIRRLLDGGDWWQRRVFDELMRLSVAGTGERGQSVFACDDAGRLIRAPA